MKTLKIKKNSKFLFNGLSMIIVSILLLGACKKSENGSSSGSGTFINYNAIAPNCMVTSFTGIPSGTFKYDNLNRILETNYFNNDSFKITYTYKGNTIIQNQNFIFPDGSKYSSVTTSYLNLSGLIEKSIENNNDKSTTITDYIYNGAGYLIREIKTSTYRSQTDTSTYTSKSGTSYIYENENQTKEYSLYINSLGVVVDSTLVTSTEYDTKLPGKIEAFTAWIERKGKANKNEIKSISRYDSQSPTTTNYSYVIGSNGCPSTINITGSENSTSNLIWICK